jgi:uncharacterized delta-60 repeat protein
LGAGGKVTTSFASVRSLPAVAVQADDKILVAGNSFNGANHDFALARYNADGTLDAGFGTGATVTTDFGSGFAVAIQADGEIIVAGTATSDDFGLS